MSAHPASWAHERAPRERPPRALATACLLLAPQFMRSEHAVCLTFTLLFGCQHTDEGGGAKDHPGDGSAKGDGPSARADAAAPPDMAVADPLPTHVPAQWMRPPDCHGVGNSCDDGCLGSACQLDGNVCINFAEVGKSQTAMAPYCLAYACMTYEEASCFCTGSVAASSAVCKAGPAAVLGLCAAEEGSCASTPCCDGLTCVKVPNAGSFCYRACKNNGDCDTGCCTDRKDTGTLECAPAAACQHPCAKQGATFAEASDCCNGLCNATSMEAGFLGCRLPCAADGDCASGCCQLYSGADFGFCADAHYCACGRGAGGKGCAPGTTCATTDNPDAPACLTDCKLPGDCASGCCTQPVPGTDHGVCVDKSKCH